MAIYDAFYAIRRLRNKSSSFSAGLSKQQNLCVSVTQGVYSTDTSIAATPAWTVTSTSSYIALYCIEERHRRKELKDEQVGHKHILY